jgi:hypothetical protein
MNSFFGARERLIQQALGSAYTALRLHHPQWAEALFDEQFLFGRFQFLLRGNFTLPDAATLASWWADHLGLSEATRTRWIPQIIPAARLFLETLRSKLEPTAQSRLAHSS